jgi:hypothetical protein
MLGVIIIYNNDLTRTYNNSHKTRTNGDHSYSYAPVIYM